MKLARLALLAAVGVAIAAFAGVFQPSGAASAPADTSGGITVLGTGSANVTPDRASFAFGSVSQAATANAALAASSQTVARVIAALKKAGVAQADIQTSEVSLSPRMNDNGDQIVGYTASNTVTATVKKLGDAGDIVDAAVGAGANQVYGPNLLASDQDAAYRNALKGAVADARTKAEVLAAASNATLGKITAIVEGGGAAPHAHRRRREGLERADRSGHPEDRGDCERDVRDRLICRHVPKHPHALQLRATRHERRDSRRLAAVRPQDQRLHEAVAGERGSFRSRGRRR